MQKKHDPMFQKVIAKSEWLGIFDILGLHQEWNTELVAQFYATTWRSGEGFDSTLNFTLKGYRFEFKITELPTIFAFAGNDFNREAISTERTILDNELAPLYYHGNERHFAPIMVCFSSTTSSTTSSGTHSHPSEVTALVSVARQGTSYYPYLMISLFHASVCSSG
jgi:hypothetical protein